MWASGLDPFQVLEEEDAIVIIPVFRQYNMFMRAKNIGVTIGLTDISPDMVDDFATIQGAVDDVENRRRKRKK